MHFYRLLHMQFGVDYHDMFTVDVNRYGLHERIRLMYIVILLLSKLPLLLLLLLLMMMMILNDIQIWHFGE